MAENAKEDEARLALLPPSERPRIAWLALIGVGQAAATVLVATLVDDLFGQAAAGLETAAWPLVLLGLAIPAVSWLRYRERLDGERLGQAVAHHVRRRLADHLVRLPSVTGRRASGDVLLRFIGDLGALRNWYARGVVSLLVAVPVVAGGIGAITWLDSRMGIAICAAFGLVAVAQMRMSAHLRGAGDTARRMRGRLASDVAERVDALASVQAFGRSAKEARRIERRSQNLAEAMIERARWSGLLRGTTEWIALGAPVVVIVVWLMSGESDVGVGASTMAVGAMLTPRVRELGRVLEHYTLAGISRDRIAEFLARNLLDERRDGKGLRRRQGHLKLKDVSLRGVFEGVSAEVRPGARIALVGRNGAGKSRLLGVIAGLEDPTSGTVVLDRQDLTLRRRASLRKVVALAGVDTPLMRGTVDGNIHYGARASEEEAAAIRELGGYDALVEDLPRGGATRLGPGGKGLSQGQKRRVILLRALMRRPLVLLLDEVESGMDDDGLAALTRVFERFEGVILMATHDPDWSRRCDAVWRLEGGRLTVERAQPEKVRKHG